jgi:hypothetical protein
MNMGSERSGGVETIELSQRPSAVSLVVTVMALILNFQIALVILTRPMDWALIALLLAAGGSTAWLGAIALTSMLPTRLTMDKDGITVAKFLQSTTVAWLDLATARLIPSVGTLSDDPSADVSGRLAVGLFLKSRKTPRQHELDADILVFAAAESDVGTLLKLVEHINEFKAAIGSGRPDPSRRTRKAAPTTPSAAFRRPRSAA